MNELRLVVLFVRLFIVMLVKGMRGSAIRPKKLIISFSGQFFKKLMRQGGFIFYFLLLQIRMRVFIFFPAKV